MDVAMRVFWAEGYEGATLARLTEAMGINRRSLYEAFGDKRELFRKVVERYVQGPGAYVAAAMQEQTAVKTAEALLHGAVDAHTAPGSPTGCLLVQSALTARPADEAIRKDLAHRRESAVEALGERFERAKRDGDLTGSVDASALARYVVTVSQGLAVQASGGVQRSDLHRVASQALEMWPSA